MDRYSSHTATTGGSLKPILGVAVAAFLLGALVVGYFAWSAGFEFGMGEEAAPVEQTAQNEVVWIG